MTALTPFPPDLNQAVEATEAAAWATVGVTGFKKGDRVPPGATFTYHWDTHSLADDCGRVALPRPLAG